MAQVQRLPVGDPQIGDLDERIERVLAYALDDPLLESVGAGALPGEAHDGGEELGEGRVAREREVDASTRGDDGHTSDIGCRGHGL